MNLNNKEFAEMLRKGTVIKDDLPGVVLVSREIWEEILMRLKEADNCEAVKE